MPKQFTLGKDERLKSRKLIGQVFSEGKKFNLALYRIHYLWNDYAGPNPGKLQFGIAVPVRVFKKAVDRNRIKRMTKEAWRLQKTSLQQLIPSQKQLAVFLVYTGNEIATYKEISETVKRIIDKLLQIVSKMP